MTDVNRNRIVIDNGSTTIKAGYAGEDNPHIVFPSVLLHQEQSNVNLQRLTYFGDKALIQHSKNSYENKIGILKYPIQRGVINDWGCMEEIWNFTLKDELAVDPEECYTLLSESSLASDADREKMGEIMFETFKVPALCTADSGLLSLFEAGRTTGIVLKSGGSITTVVPVFNGFAIRNAIQSMEIGGNELTQFLITLLHGQHNLSTTTELSIANYIKKTKCYIALDWEIELELQCSSYEPPFKFDDKTIINFKDERFRCPEALFQPSLLNSVSNTGIHELVHSSIMKCSVDIRKELYSNIVIAGGNTLFPRFSDRLQKELVLLSTNNQPIKIISPKNRKISSWIGGSVLGSLTSTDNFFVTKYEYQEYGPNQLHRKSFSV